MGPGQATVYKPLISIMKLLLQPTTISAIIHNVGVLFVSLQNSRVQIQNCTFILRTLLANLCDMAFLKTAKSSPRNKFVYLK